MEKKITSNSDQSIIRPYSPNYRNQNGQLGATLEENLRGQEIDFYETQKEKIRALLVSRKFSDGEITILIRLAEGRDKETTRKKLQDLAALIKTWNMNYTWNRGQIIETDFQDPDFPKYTIKPNLVDLIESYRPDNSPVILNNPVPIIVIPKPEPKPKVSIDKLKEQFPAKGEEQEFQEELTKLKAEIERVGDLIESADWEGAFELQKFLLDNKNHLQSLYEVLNQFPKKQAFYNMHNDNESMYSELVTVEKEIFAFFKEYFVPNYKHRANFDKDFKIFATNTNQLIIKNDSRKFRFAAANFNDVLALILSGRMMILTIVSRLNSKNNSFIRLTARLFDIKSQSEVIRGSLPEQNQNEVYLAVKTEILDTRHLLFWLRDLEYDLIHKAKTAEKLEFELVDASEMTPRGILEDMYDKYLSKDNFDITRAEFSDFINSITLSGIIINNQTELDMIKKFILYKVASIYAKFDYRVQNIENEFGYVEEKYDITQEENIGQQNLHKVLADYQIPTQKLIQIKAEQIDDASIDRVIDLYYTLKLLKNSNIAGSGVGKSMQLFIQRELLNLNHSDSTNGAQSDLRSIIANSIVKIAEDITIANDQSINIFTKAAIKLIPIRLKYGFMLSDRFTTEALDIMISTMKLYFQQILNVQCQKSIQSMDSNLLRDINKILKNSSK